MLPQGKGKNLWFSTRLHNVYSQHLVETKMLIQQSNSFCLRFGVSCCCRAQLLNIGYTDSTSIYSYIGEHFHMLSLDTQSSIPLIDVDINSNHWFHLHWQCVTLVLRHQM